MNRSKIIVSVENVSRQFPLDHETSQRKAHGFVQALKDTTMSVQAGEFVAIAGPSGSGKSTLLNLIGGMDKPSTGEIVIDGVKTSGLGTKEMNRLRREKIGFVFQTFNLIPVFTALENVEFPLLIQNVPTAERQQRAFDALASVGLAERAEHRPDRMSGGERQRVAVARAIVHRPALVLADEPTANLDTHNATQLIDLMHELNQRNHLTFIFSTHDARLLSRAPRIFNLCDGSITSESVNNEVAYA